MRLASTEQRGRSRIAAMFLRGYCQRGCDAAMQRSLLRIIQQEYQSRGWNYDSRLEQFDLADLQAVIEMFDMDKRGEMTITLAGELIVRTVLNG